MNNILNEILKEFDDKYSNFNLNDTGKFRDKVYSARDLMRKFISQSLLKYKEAIIKEVEGMKKNVDWSKVYEGAEQVAEQSGKYGFNKGIDSVINLLKK